MVEKTEEYHEMLIETAVEQDDDLMEAYMEGEVPSVEDIKRCIRKGTRDLAFFPTFPWSRHPLNTKVSLLSR